MSNSFYPASAPLSFAKCCSGRSGMYIRVAQELSFRKPWPQFTVFLIEKTLLNFLRTEFGPLPSLVLKDFILMAVRVGGTILDELVVSLGI